MDDFIQGLIKGAKETPLAYFSPAIALWRLLVSTTDSLCATSNATATKNSQAK